MLKHSARARGAGTHGDVLNLHTESVLNVHTVFLPTHTPNTTPTEHHTETDREKDRDREKTEKERGKKMKEETTRGGRRRKREKKKQRSHVHQRWHVRVGVTVLFIISQENAIWNTWVP